MFCRCYWLPSFGRAVSYWTGHLGAELTAWESEEDAWGFAHSIDAVSRHTSTVPLEALRGGNFLHVVVKFCAWNVATAAAVVCSVQAVLFLQIWELMTLWKRAVCWAVEFIDEVERIFCGDFAQWHSRPFRGKFRASSPKGWCWNLVATGIDEHNLSFVCFSWWFYTDSTMVNHQ